MPTSRPAASTNAVATLDQNGHGGVIASPDDGNASGGIELG
jgi:hypothetical protein